MLKIIILFIITIFCILYILYILKTPYISKKNHKKIEKYKNTLNNEIPKKYQLFFNVYKNKSVESLDLMNKTEYIKEPIPKVLYRTWCDKNVKNCGGRDLDNKTLEYTINNLGSSWEQIIYYDNDIKYFLETEFGKEHRITKAYFLINEKYGAARADLFRYLIIYKKGGLYLDMKSAVINSPFPEIPYDKDIWVSTWGGKINTHLFPDTGEYHNWYIYARKGSPILKDIIEKVVDNIYELQNNPNTSIKHITTSENTTSNKMLVLCTTGPIAFTTAINNSKYKNTIYHNNNIQNYISYNPINISNINSMHYSEQTEPLINLKKDINYIPKTIYMTYHDLNLIPKYVKDNIQKYCDGYELKIYDDEMCINFLQKYYGDEAVYIFNNMEIKAYKADFWRYCILYIFGGYYFDIKTDFQKNIDEIFINKENTWYTVMSLFDNSLYNGIIVTPINNSIIYDAIDFIYKNQNPLNNYLIYCIKLYDLLKENCNQKLVIGDNIQKNNWKCILLKEYCNDKCDNDCDRYGRKCVIKNYNNDILFNTRYNDYPWKNI